MDVSTWILSQCIYMLNHIVHLSNYSKFYLLIMPQWSWGKNNINGIVLGFITKRLIQHSTLIPLSSVYSPLVPQFSSFSSVTQSCPTLCDPMNCSMPGLPVHQQLPEFTQINVHQVSDTVQPSHPLTSPLPPAPNTSQHQSLFQWVNSSYAVAQVLEFQL